MRTPAMAVLCCLVAACSGSGGSASKPVAPRPGATSEATSQDEPPSSAAPSGPPPRLRIDVTRDTPAGLRISLQNREGKPVSLASALRVEVERNGRFVPAGEARIELRGACDTQLPPCITLAPGAELLPPQCACVGCSPLPAGRYRAVAKGCEDAFTLASAVLELPE